jgi:hypothetical protein
MTVCVQIAVTEDSCCACCHHGIVAVAGCFELCSDADAAAAAASAVVAQLLASNTVQ